MVAEPRPVLTSPAAKETESADIMQTMSGMTAWTRCLGCCVEDGRWLGIVDLDLGRPGVIVTDFENIFFIQVSE